MESPDHAEGPVVTAEIAPQLPKRPRRPTRDLPSRPSMPEPSTSRDPVAPEKAISHPLDGTVSGAVVPSATTEAIVPGETAAGDTLTPLRAHYLKKALLALGFNSELTYISSSPLPPPLSVLSLLGPPFTPLPRDAHRVGARDVPFLRFMFRQFVLTFPFLATAPKDFFPAKLQPFVDSLLARNLSSELSLFPEEDPDVDPEHSGTAKALAKVEKHMALLLGSAIKLHEQEEVVRLTQKDLDRLEAAQRRRQRRYEGSRGAQFSVNVVCVRNVSEKGRVTGRRRNHDVRCDSALDWIGKPNLESRNSSFVQDERDSTTYLFRGGTVTSAPLLMR